VRVKTFLGADLAEDALTGFTSALYRDDLPSATEIAELHAKKNNWNVETVIVCGIAEMLRCDLPLDAVPRAALDSAYMAWRRQHESNIVSSVEIGSSLEAIVLADEAGAEVFFRTSIEPELRAGLEHVSDLYMLINQERWSALAGRLAVDWLVQNSTLPIAVEMELLDAASRNADRNYLAQLIALRGRRIHASRESFLGWLATDFIIDFEHVRSHLINAADENCDFLWHIRRRASAKGHDGHDAFVPLTIAQWAIIVEAFGSSWPHCARPTGVSTGDMNPWNASDFIERAIHSIAAEPVAEATETLERLLGDAAPTYAATIRHALARQRRLRRDHDYVPASIGEVRSVASSALPESIDDMRAYFGDRIATVQTRMHSTNTDMWEAYWNAAKPRYENFCRNRLVEHISGQLPAAIRFEPEMHMPNQKRADIAAIRDGIGLPVEIKGQWHPAIWDAPVEQLAALYTRDWHAEGRGVYIVIWFGNVPKKQLSPHPDGLTPPKTPEALRSMLIDRIPESIQGLIDVFVVDVSKML
jgi:hypothetical protein